MQLSAEERFEVRFGSAFSRPITRWTGQGHWDRLFSVLLVVAIIGSVGTIAYTFQPLKPEDRFTEFYILGPENKAANYPREVFLGENSQVIVGIVNREQMTITYRVEINIGGLRVNQIGPLTLKHDEKWEQIVNFTATKLGLGQKAEFRLYRDEESAPYRTLYLWLDVKE